MFTLALSPKFWAPVKIEYTNDEGKKVVGTFEAQFKRHNQEQLDTLRERLRDNPADSLVDFNAEFLRENLTGFRGIEIPADEDNGVVKITADETTAMLEFLLSRNMGQALVEAFTAQAPKARAKN